MEKILIYPNDRILIIAPHPDDECIGVGGVLALFPKLCDVWLLTDGRYGRVGKSCEETAKIRKEEFYNEMMYIGVHDFKFFEKEDGILMKHLDMFCQEDLSVYTKIFVPNAEDEHTDHKAAYQIVVNALIKQGLTNIQVYQYEIAIPLGHVTHILDITEVFDTKLKLISYHQSQKKPIDYCKLVNALNKYRAYTAYLSNSYIEGYYLAPVKKLNNSEYLSEISKQKMMQNLRVLDLWMSLKQNKIFIENWLIEHQCRTIAIYGYGILGKHLYKELRDSEAVKIQYVIDKMKAGQNDDILIVSPDFNFEKVDIVIVTAVYYYDDVCKELKNKGFCNFVSLESVISELISKL